MLLSIIDFFTDPSVKSAAKKTKIVTSTPDVKRKTTKDTTREGELLNELAKVEVEKSLLQVIVEQKLCIYNFFIEFHIL